MCKQFSYTLAHIAEWFCGYLLVLRSCCCVHEPFHTSASLSSQSLGPHSATCSLLFQCFFFSVSFPFPKLFLAVFFPCSFCLLLTISPVALLAWSDKKRPFLFTFCVNLKWGMATPCWYPCEITDHPELQSDGASQEMAFGDGVWNLWAHTARVCQSSSSD